MSDEPLIGREAQGRHDREMIEAARRQIDGPGGPAEMDGGPSSAASTLPNGLRPDDLPRDSLPGYEILDEIHRGGQGVVYLAVQKATRRQVAVKVMREGPFSGRHDKIRFEREIHVLGQLQHPNIVTIHDSGMAGGYFYFVMDFIPGQPLDEYVADAARVSARAGVEGRGTRPAEGLSVRGALRLFATICQAVHAAHLRGIIHRDLKPSNIRVDAEGRPQVLDFGLARMVDGQTDEEDAPQAMTVTGQFVGSMPWASPEQAEGVPGKIDVRTDVYSLGVVLYQLLTGRFPYNVVGPMRDVLDRIVSHEPARPSTICRQIDGEVETIVLKCLAKQRERRYQSAGELGRDIEHYLAGEPIEARRDSSLYVLRKTLARHKELAAFSSILLVALAGLVVTLALESARIRQQRDKAVIAETLASQERDRADHQAEAVRHALYSHQIGLAQLAQERWRTNLFLELLHECPSDLRNWEWFRLTSMLDRSAQILPECGTVLALVPSTGMLISADLSGDISVWNVNTWRIVKSLHAHTGEVPCLAVSADGRRFVSGGEDRFVLVGDTSTGEILRRMQIPRRIRSLALSPSGDLLAIGGGHNDQTKVLTVYEVKTGQERWSKSMEMYGTIGVCFSPDGARVASSWEGASVRVWDSATGQQLLSLRGHAYQPHYLGFSPDGRRIIGGTPDWLICVWDAETERELETFRGHDDAVRCVALSKDGRLMASCSADQTIRLWDARTGKPLRTLLGHHGRINSVAFLPDSTKLISAGDDNTLRVWDLTTREDGPTWQGAERFYAVVFSPNGEHFASASGDGRVALWDVRREGPPLWSVPAHAAGDFPRVAFSPDGGRILSSGIDGTIKSWDAATGCKLAEWRGDDTPIPAVVFSPDGRLVASGSLNGSCRVWDSLTGSPLLVLPHRDRVWAVAFSPDGRRIVSGGSERLVRLWDSRTGELIGTFEGQTDTIEALLFTSDGRRIISGGLDGALRAWDAANGQCLFTTAKSHADHILCGALSPDGQRIVTGGKRLIELWDASTGARIYSFYAHNSSVYAVTFSPDGRDILSAGGDQTIRLWPSRRLAAH